MQLLAGRHSAEARKKMLLCPDNSFGRYKDKEETARVDNASFRCAAQVSAFPSEPEVSAIQLSGSHGWSKVGIMTTLASVKSDPSYVHGQTAPVPSTHAADCGPFPGHFDKIQLKPEAAPIANCPAPIALCMAAKARHLGTMEEK